MWNLFRKRFLEPRVDDDELRTRLETIRTQLPTPVFWLLGKTQSGKTSVIRALTGNSQAEIGSGFQPCTNTARLYPFPNDQAPLFKFLDTRGLGEVKYDPTEDMQVLEKQSHLLIVTAKALDHAQETLFTPLRRIRRAHPRWPMIVVQTCLHEGYPDSSTEHPQPYPFAQTPLPPVVPADLARSLVHQRNVFKEAGISDEHTHFVPVDFTLPEDGYQEQFYGVEPLWSAIEDLLPKSVASLLSAGVHAREVKSVFLRKARPHIISYSLAAGAAGAIPLPLLDLPLLLAIHAKMFHAIASIYGQKMDRKRMAEISGTLGAGFVARMAARELLKVIPIGGSAVAAVFAASSTYALGQTLCAYFHAVEGGETPDKKILHDIYQRELEAGKTQMQTMLNDAKKAQDNAENTSGEDSTA